MVELRNLKGTKDYDVPEKLLQNELLKIITGAYQAYGYNPLETPMIEFRDILSSKYAGGAEILKETYILSDNGERELALRYDLTVPFCRYVGMNERKMRLPFKRYEIGKVFRDGPIKLGRLREFYQCDADVVGSDNLIFDAEALAIMCTVYSKIADFKIEINNRKLLVGIIKDAGIESDDLASGIILSIDKYKKIGIKGIQDELMEKGIGPSTYEPIFEKIIVKDIDNKSNWELIEYYEKNLTNELALQGIEELKTVLNYCEKMGIADNIIFRPELARGLEIYTGTIFEAFFKNSKITSSIGAGGRYDKIIGKFLSKERIVPAVGFTVGLDVIMSELMDNPENYPLIKLRKTAVEVLVVPMRVELGNVLSIITELRDLGIKCELYTKKKGIKGGLSLANSMNIPISIIIGKRELDEGMVTIKDMIKEEQFNVKIDKCSQKVKELLQK